MNEPKTLWHTIEIKVPADMLVKTPSGRVSLRKTLTKTFNISKANKQPAIKLTPANVNHAEIINDGAQTTRARMRQMITKAPLPAPVKLKLKSMKNINKMIDEFQLYLKDLKPMELPVKVKKEVKALIKEVEVVKETVKKITKQPKIKQEKKIRKEKPKSTEVKKIEKKMDKLLYHGSNNMLYMRISEDDAREIMKYAKEIQNITKKPYPAFRMTAEDQLISIDTIEGTPDGHIEIIIDYDD
jgi:hypothetical protein